MDPARSEAPLLPHRVPHFPPPAILENSLSAPFQLPRMLRQITLHQVPQIITAADVGEGGWIPTFPPVVHLEMEIDRTGVDGPEAFNLTPFHGFSPALESLRVIIAYFPCSPIADLLDSFPHLQGLAVVTNYRLGDRVGFYKPPVAIQSSGPITGSLELHPEAGMGTIVSKLLSKPNGLHFRELGLAWNCEEDVLFTVALVELCSPMLETLKIKYKLVGKLAGSINLSKAIKLKEAIFMSQNYSQWMTTTLRTLTPNHGNLRQISLHESGVLYALHTDRHDPANVRSAIGEATYQEWLELDRVLTHIWESHSIYLKVLYDIPRWVDGPSARRCVESLFPEVTTRGIADLVDSKHWV